MCARVCVCLCVCVCVCAGGESGGEGEYACSRAYECECENETETEGGGDGQDEWRYRRLTAFCLKTLSCINPILSMSCKYWSRGVAFWPIILLTVNFSFTRSHGPVMVAHVVWYVCDLVMAGAGWQLRF